MNILPKKKWHVRTKENVARVRRDQKLAAEEEERIRQRALLGEQQFKVNLLRKNAEDRLFNLYGTKGRSDGTSKDGGEDIDLQSSSGHVNFFAELEEEDRKNLGTGNKDNEEEKRKEREEYETKMGILVQLGGGSNELTKSKSWYEKVPTKKKADEASKETKDSRGSLPCGVMSIEKTEELRKLRKEEKKKKKSKKKDRKRHRKSSDHDERSERKRAKHHRRRHSSDSDGEERVRYAASPRDDEKKRKLEALRLERRRREEEEKKKTFDLLHPVREDANKSRITPKYSSQFNPELARQNRFK